MKFALNRFLHGFILSLQAYTQQSRPGMALAPENFIYLILLIKIKKITINYLRSLPSMTIVPFVSFVCGKSLKYQNMTLT